MNKLIKYREENQTVKNDQVLISDCNALTVINIGTTNISINNLVLSPGDQYVSQFNEGEINVTRYNLVLNGGEAYVIRKTQTNG